MVVILRLAPALLFLGFTAYNMRTVARVFSPLVKAVQGIQCEMDMAAIRKILATQMLSQQSLPQSQAEFERLLRENIKKSSGVADPTVDRFKHKYRYEVDRAARGEGVRDVGFRLVSAGPDGRFGTRDDLVVEWKSSGQ